MVQLSSSALQRVMSSDCGVVRDAFNTLITTVPYDLPSPQINYTPNNGFLGLDTFSFDVSNGTALSAARVSVTVSLLDCHNDSRGCNNGR